VHYKCSIFSPVLCLYSTVSRLDMLYISLCPGHKFWFKHQRHLRVRIWLLRCRMCEIPWMHRAKKNTNLKTHAVFMFGVSYFNNVQGWGYFREIGNPFWCLLQRRPTSPTPVCRQLHANLRKSRNRSCKLQKPEASCEDRQRSQRAGTAGFQATKYQATFPCTSL
jgi:hypothetical protein